MENEEIILFYLVFGLCLESQCEMNTSFAKSRDMARDGIFSEELVVEIFTLDMSGTNRFEHRISQRVEGLCKEGRKQKVGIS